LSAFRHSLTGSGAARRESLTVRRVIFFGNDADPGSLELLKEFEGIAFFKIAEGYGGHTQILGMFEEGRPAPIPHARRGMIMPEATALHQFAFEIDKAHHQPELNRLTGLGLTVTTAVHGWCHWRSIYVLDPEDNVVELVCYDESVNEIG
jgi:hypothetical protein